MDQSFIANTPFQEILKTKGVDMALHTAGNYHKYQYKLIFFLSIQWLITAFVLMIQPFLTQVPVFLCTDPSDPTKTIECDEAQSCKEGVRVAPDSPYNLVIEFGLWCEHAGRRDLVGTIFFLGGSVGTLLFSHVADTYGRKGALLISYALGAVCILVMGITSNFTVMLVFLSLSWAGFDAYIAFSFIILSECGGTKFRGVSNAMLLVVWGIGMCLFIAIAYLLQNWRTEVIWALAIPGCLFCLFFTQIQESPRFLYAKRRLEECEKALLAIAKVNGRQEKIEALIDPTQAKNISMSKMSQQSMAGPTKSNQTTYLTLFTNKWLRRRFLLFTGLIIYLFLAYNGILLALSGLGGNIYVNSLIVSAAELFAYIASIFMLDRVKRKKSFLYIMLSAAFGGVIFAMIPLITCESHFICSRVFLEGAMSLVIKFAVSLSFGLIYVYGSELFPTTARSKCIGLAASTGRATGTIITWLNSGLLALGVNPMIFYGLLGFFVLILLRWLPETFGHKLLDDLPDSEMVEDVCLSEEDLDNEEKAENVENAAVETTQN